MEDIEHPIGTLIVRQRKTDGYINASKLALAYKEQKSQYKNPKNWFEKDRTIEYIELLSSKTGLEVDKLMQERGKRNIREVWIHPKLAVSFAMWLSPEFEMMVSDWVEQWLLTG